MNRVDLSRATRRYRVIAREPIPSNLCERLSTLHAQALLRGGNKVTIAGVRQTPNHWKGDSDAVKLP